MNASGLSLPEEKEKESMARVYLVVEYDKTQIILDSPKGTLENPVWDRKTNFDVSRVGELLTMQLYARLRKRNSSLGGSGSGGDGAADSDDKKQSEEVFLGSCKIDTNDLTKPLDGTILLSSGTGKIRVKAEFKPNAKHHLTTEDFELLKVIGKGSFGKVMQVRKKDTQRIYAMKTIRKALIVSRSEVTHTLAERTVLAQIDNPFVVPLKFSFQSPEKLYLVLAFINGGELFHHLQREGRFDLNRSRFYTAELLCALECLHEYNVIYRDLKPENILLDYTGHIALCDFGLCKLNMEGDERTNTFCGTPEYLAPELLLGQGYTKVVDWWTLGVLFYEMLTGLPPFYDTDTNEMYRKILSDPLRFPEYMDREAKSLLQGLLERNPERRLGVNGAAEIKAHPFFAQIDWKRLLNKKYAAPFRPAVHSATDTSNFDQEFTNEVPADSVVDNDFYLSDSMQKQFGGWTYTNTDSKLANSGNW
jgi:serum/glucocorticoid-regulated kinase 2